MNIKFNEIKKAESLDNYKGKDIQKFAMAAAIAGQHNMLVWGAPSSNKDELLLKLPQLMPNLLEDEEVSVNQIRVLSGEDTSSIRPFRTPYMTSSIREICGDKNMIGECTHAHKGVIFLEDAQNFRTSVLQMFRVPIETKTINLCYAGHTKTLPADFQLIMSVLPCPCGNWGSPDKICLCSEKAIKAYWHKFSQPLLDRIEININVNNDKSFEGWETKETRELWERTWTVDELRAMITKAWTRQYERQGKLNNELTPMEIGKSFKVTEAAAELIPKDLDNYRKFENIVKLARTIADMNDSDNEYDEWVGIDEVRAAIFLNRQLPKEIF